MFTSPADEEGFDWRPFMTLDPQNYTPRIFHNLPFELFFRQVSATVWIFIMILIAIEYIYFIPLHYVPRTYQFLSAELFLTSEKRSYFPQEYATMKIFRR